MIYIRQLSIIFIIAIILPAPAIDAQTERARHAYQLIQEKKYEEAERMIETDLAVIPSKDTTNILICLNLLGLCQSRRNDYAAALKTNLLVLNLVPKQAKTYGNIGWYFYKLGDLDSAIIATNTCLALDSTLGFAWANLGLYHLKQHDYLTAKRDYFMATNFITSIPSLDEAISDLRNLIKIDSNIEEEAEIHIDELKSTKRILDLLNQARTNSEQGNTNVADSIYLEALKSGRRIFQRDHHVLTACLNNYAVFLNEQGRAVEAEPLFKEVLAMSKRLFKGDHPDLATSIGNMASFLNKKGRTAEAEPLYKEVLEMRRRLFKGDHPDIARSIGNLAVFLNEQGRAAEAELLYKEALEMKRRLFKGDHPDIALGISNIAVFLNEQGRATEAEPLYKEALEMKRRLFKGDHPDLATSIGNIASFLNKQGRASEAEPLYKEALEMKRRLFKGDHLDIALGISNMAVFLNEQGRAAEAEPLYKEALEMKRRLFEGDHPDIALGINNMAVFLNEQGRVAEAEPLYKEALEMRRRLFKRDHPNLAISIGNMAIFLNEQGRAAEAEPLYKEALEMRKRLFKGGHPDLATSISNMASFLNEQGRLAEAEPLYHEALAMRKRLFKGDHPDLATSINNMAFFLNEQGRAAEAEPLYKEALEMQRRLSKGDHPDLAISINNMAAFLYEQGRAAEAEPLFKEALEMYRRSFNGDHPVLAISINNMAAFLDEQGRAAEAEPLYKEALEMRSRLFKVDHPDLATSIGNMAFFLNKQGRAAEAEPLYKEALEMQRRLFKGDHPNLATSINNMALFLNEQGRAAEAEPLYKEALEMRKRLFKGDHPDIASSIGNMAFFLNEQGRAAEAEPLYKEALEMQRRLFKGDHSYLAWSVSNMALFLDEQGHAAEAEPLYKEALEMQRRLFKGDHPYLAWSISNMALFLDEQGRTIEAESYFIEASENTIRYLRNNFRGLSEKERDELHRTVAYRFPILLSFASRSHNKSDSIKGAVLNRLLSSKGMLQQESRNLRKHILASSDTAVSLLFASWISCKERIARAYSMSLQEMEKKKIDLDALLNESNDLEKELSRKSELFAKRYQQKTVKWNDIVAALKPGEAAVELVRFRYYHKRWTDSVFYAALIVTSETKDHPEIVVLENGKELDSLYFEHYRISVNVNGTKEESYQHYWSKIADKLKGINKIYLSPDGVYNQINLLTLQQPDGKYLFETLDIQLVSNTKEIINLKSPQPSKNSSRATAAMFGFPNYNLGLKQQQQLAANISNMRERDFGLNPLDTLDRNQCKPLPGTEKEVKEIAAFLTANKWNVDVNLEDHAIEEAVKAVKSPRVLHVATHGYFMRDEELKENDGFNRMMGMEKFRYVENPLLRSGLLLAGAKRSLSRDSTSASTTVDNGILTAYEAMNLDLEGTELVVLSACETGLGVVRNGEGVYGLQRAFLTAGAKTVLMSLWKVNDEVTKQLMVSFYKNWLKLRDKRKAFREAQLEIKAKYPEPFYWGAFVMVGE